MVYLFKIRFLYDRLKMEAILYKSNPWWEDDFSFDDYEREHYLTQLQNVLDNPDIIFLTGLRGVGKSSLMKNFIHRYHIEPKEKRVVNGVGDFMLL